MNHVDRDVSVSDDVARPIALALNSNNEAEAIYAGLVLESPLALIDQSLINAYAEMFGDKNPIHLDPQFAQLCGLPTTIAHGALVFSMATGLAHGFGCFEGTGTQFKEVSLKFKLPVYAGDRIGLRLKIVETKELKRGLVRITAEAEVFNQNGGIVHRYEWHGFFSRRPTHT